MPPASRKTELMDTWVGKLLVGSIGLSISGIGAMSMITLNKVDQLHDDVVTIKTTLPYISRDVSANKEELQQNATAHLSFQSQFQEIREQQFRHGWGSK